jgi:hypothetical protein
MLYLICWIVLFWAVRRLYHAVKLALRRRR